jgi:hypothetical protein
MGVLLQGFYFAPGRIAGVPSPLDGDASIPFWWDHLASQAQALAKSGLTAIWLPPPLKGASGSFSSGCDLFDDYDLGSKNQKGTIPTRYGTREQLQRCVAIMRANGIDVYVDLVENQRDGTTVNSTSNTWMHSELREVAGLQRVQAILRPDEASAFTPLTFSSLKAIAVLSVRSDRTHQGKQVISSDRRKPLSIDPPASSLWKDSELHRTVLFCGKLCPAIAWAIRCHRLGCRPIPQSIPATSSPAWSGFPHRRHQVRSNVPSTVTVTHAGDTADSDGSAF